MSEDRPLLHARRPVGRPRKYGHVPGTPSAQGPENSEAKGRALPRFPVAPVPPRLFDLDDTAAYLGISPWTVRDLEAREILRRVRVPLPNGELRKLLFDREDLDHLVALWKDQQEAS